MTVVTIVGIMMVFGFGVLVGFVLGLKKAISVLGIPKGYKVGTVTFKKIDSESK